MNIYFILNLKLIFQQKRPDFDKVQTLLFFNDRNESVCQNSPNEVLDSNLSQQKGGGEIDNPGNNSSYNEANKALSEDENFEKLKRDRLEGNFVSKNVINLS